MSKSDCLARGDIVLINFNTQSGHEQAGRRPALVISDTHFNKVTGFAVLCPITSQVKGNPFEVEVRGTKRITGVIMSNQYKSLDWVSRDAKTVDSVVIDVVNEVNSIIAKILKL
ncbi:type II toxin-antitoxin system PemK/MazF family toxin [Acerihabitans sp. KWT182]|uniref:Type II toxin-antitoxin system PemK/MazF family toxin n=1 Tax=Acerihabitans sp. KWT182 TaxID=3157919 RepID=A0AAU7Q6Z1_9GAMM